VEDPHVVKVLTIGPLESGQFNLTTQPQSITLQFTCLAAGTSTISVGLKSVESADISILWSFEKVCSAVEAVEGVSIKGLRVGTEPGLSDVIVDGITTDEFRNAFSAKEENQKQMTHYGADVDTVKFYVSSTETTVALRQPILTIARTLSQDLLHVSDPEVSGSLTRSNSIRVGQELVVELSFNCIRTGQSDISIEIPLKPSGALQFVVQKSCQMPEGVLPRPPKNIPSIPGLNIGTARGAANVIKNGLPQPKWHWDTQVVDLHMIQPSSPFITFYLTKNGSVPNIPDIRLGTPQLISTLAVAQPDLSGRASDGDIVSVDSHSTVTITFHCFETGTALYNLEIPVLPLAVEDMAPRTEPVRVSFLKECSTDPQSIVTGAGGVGITGFNIGTTKEGSDIVYNGFPRPLYYGQRHRDNPQWDAIKVPESKSSTRIFLTYGSKFLGGEEELEQVQFQAPMAVTHGHECKPSLSGPASSGGILTKNGNGLEMDVTWNCRWKGTGSVSIAIHILPHGKITFTIPKECGGLDKPAGTIVSGLTIGLTSNGEEVISNGLTQPDWLPYKPHQPPHHIEDGLSTVFYVSSLERNLGAIEPLVWCARPIANPRIIHNMHVDDGSQSTAVGDDVDIVITNEPKTLEIDYNCVGVGSTPVTVVLPILPRGSQVSFTWTLTCGSSSSYDFYSYEYLDEYYDSYYDMYSSYYDLYSDWSYEYSSSDFYYYTDDYYLLGYYGSSAYYLYSDSRSSSELLWSGLPSTDFLYNPDRGLGWINVGTGLTSQESDDVVSFGQAMEQYGLAVGVGDDSIDDTIYTVVSRKRDVSSFYLSVPLGHEVFSPPEVYARAGSKGADICSPKVLGPASTGGELKEGDTPIEMQIEYNCLRPGVTPITVKIPLGTNFLQSVNFRVIKVCRNYEPKVEWYWTASRIMLLGTLVVGFFIGLFAYQTLKNQKEQPVHQSVPTQIPIDDFDVVDSDSD
jgi:hypothetical protein